jgi:hypothetical protein
MEIARMNYYFTGVLIILFVILCFMQPAYPRNEYLNEYGVRCGEMEFRVEDRNNEQIIIRATQMIMIMTHKILV